MGEFIEAVSKVGFPIVCCWFLFRQNSKMNDFFQKQQEKLSVTIDGNTKSLDKLSKIVTRLVEMMNGGK